MRPPIDTYESAGILTCCPSTTPFGLALGPTNPGTIRVAQETLGLRCGGFSPPLLLLMPTFSLPCGPPALTDPASAPMERSATARRLRGKPSTSVLCLSPGKFSAQDNLTSELLRFL